MVSGGNTEQGETAVTFDLHPPIHIIAEFQQGHAPLAVQVGLKLGPLARVSTTRSQKRIRLFLVEVPRGWNEIQDTTGPGEQDGTYLVDEQGRRRIRFGDINSHNRAEAEVLTRFGVQQWRLGFGEYQWTCYVRKTVGGEANIFRHPHHHAHVVFEHKVKRLDDLAIGMEHCRRWLEKHFPDWMNPLAYWDIP